MRELGLGTWTNHCIHVASFPFVNISSYMLVICWMGRRHIKFKLFFFPPLWAVIFRISLIERTSSLVPRRKNPNWRGSDQHPGNLPNHLGRRAKNESTTKVDCLILSGDTQSWKYHNLFLAEIGLLLLVWGWVKSRQWKWLLSRQIFMQVSIHHSAPTAILSDNYNFFHYGLILVSSLLSVTFISIISPERSTSLPLPRPPKEIANQ